MTTLFNDIKFAFRQLCKSPIFTAVTVLTLALGIGATTAIFSIVNGVLLRPLAYPESNRLVSLHEFIPAISEKLPILPVCARHFMEWRKRCSSFESLSLLESCSMNLTGKGEPERLKAVRVSGNVFEMLGTQPSLGRTFIEEEDAEDRNRVVVISDRLWRRKFDSQPSVMGANVILDDEAYSVVGVLPVGFRIPNPNPYKIPEMAISSRADVFVPKVFMPWDYNTLMGSFNYHVIARLKDGVTREAATAELNVIAAQLEEMAGENVELRAIVKPLREAIVKNSRQGLLVIFAAVGLVLLIACVNMTIIHLVRAEGRSFDAAVRLALGANRVRLLRQALTETLLLTVIGATLGVMVAWSGLGVLIRITPSDIPRLDQVRMDTHVLLFAVLLAGATALLCGLLPAWRTARSNAEQVLRAGGRTTPATSVSLCLHNTLVAIEVGLGVVLLMTAGLLLGSFVRVMRTDKGFHAPTVLAADITPPERKYNTPERRSELHGRLLDYLASAPGIQSAALVSRLPLQGQAWLSAVWIQGDLRPAFERPIVNVRFVNSQYFQTMGVPLLDGRIFDERDRSRRVSVISQRLADILWPKQDYVVGNRFLYEDHKEYEVIGVVRDVLVHADQKPAAMMYRPYWDGAPVETTIVVRAAADAFSMANPVREAIRSVDADLPISKMYTMREVLAAAVSYRRFQILLASSFAVCALLLASLGVYGVVSYSVKRRTSEIGVRMAFGAHTVSVYIMVFRRGLVPVGIGLLVGVVGACALGCLLQSMLVDISPTDPLTIATVVTIMSLSAIAACYIPARRAARIDPMEALRYE